MKIINGNNIEILKQYQDNYFDAIITDPPYGLGKEPNAEKLMKDWIEKGYHEIIGTGFMGKEWDAFIPQPIFWKEVFRVLKPGGHVLSFFGTRTYDWGVMSMRFAGFEVRDCIQWLYGSGFPKSHNISKAIDKMYGAEREILGEKIRGDVQKAKENGSGYLSDPANRNNKKQFGYGTELITKASTEEAKQWDGWGSALKPANEPIVLARKPLEKGLSIAENVLKWGTGAINIDGCRVNFKDEADYKESTQKNQHGDFGTKPMTNNNVYGDYSMIKPKNYAPEGRFPANIILTHHPECECKGLKVVKSNSHFPEMKVQGYGKNYGGKTEYIEEGERVKEETVEAWDCHEDCPIKILDEQSGESKSSKSANIGGASRFFYVAKASKSERNKGTIGENSYLGKTAEAKNIHPTVKPIKLMQYLVRLITPPNGIVLDPFCGSGTTGIACKLEGFNFVGIEQDAEYCKIANARISNIEENQLKLF